MTKRLFCIWFSMVLILLMAVPSWGLDSDPNWVEPDDKNKGQKEYSRDNASLKGGHDTVTSEAVELLVDSIRFEVR